MNKEAVMIASDERLNMKAAELMGWTRILPGLHDYVQALSQHGTPPWGYPRLPLPNYTTNMSDAWSLVEKMYSASGHYSSVSINIVPWIAGSEGPVTVSVDDGLNDEWFIEGKLGQHAKVITQAFIIAMEAFDETEATYCE